MWNVHVECAFAAIAPETDASALWCCRVILQDSAGNTPLIYLMCKDSVETVSTAVFDEQNMSNATIKAGAGTAFHCPSLTFHRLFTAFP